MAKLLKVTGEVLEIIPANGKAFTKEELLKFVGGSVQESPCNDGVIVFDKSKKSNQVNINATVVYGSPIDYIVGNAVLCNIEEIA